MRSYALRRVALLVPTLVGLTFFAFALVHLAPGDPATEYLRRTSDAQPTPEDVAATRAELGLDRPLAVQYLSWVGNLARGDLGTSYSTRRPVAQELRRRVPATVQLAIPAAALAVAIAVPLGVLSAVYRNRLVDQLVRIASLAGASLPSFWLALLLILVFAVHWSLVEVAGREQLSSVVLPAVALALPPTALLSRFTRSAMLEALGDDYVRTARAKGLRPSRVVGRHALRNALVPVITAFGTTLGHLVAGTVVVETIFAWPGLGKFTLDAIQQRDYPALQGVVLFAGAAFVAINLAVDLTYGVIDPRIRVGRREGDRV